MTVWRGESALSVLVFEWKRGLKSPIFGDKVWRVKTLYWVCVLSTHA